MFQKITIPEEDQYTRSNYSQVNGVYQSDGKGSIYKHAVVILTSANVEIIFDLSVVTVLIDYIQSLLDKKDKPEIITKDNSCKEGILMSTDDLVRIIGAANSGSNNKASDLTKD